MISKLPRIYPILALTALAIFISIPSSTLASVSRSSPEINENLSIQSLKESNSDGIQAPPSVTIAINLPIIEQNAPPATPTPINGYPVPVLVTPLVTFTPTVTPIPIQTGSTNLPIVIGALVIIVVVLLAWFLVWYIPRRVKE